MLNEGHCGYVAIIGRPNVGKSTLLNYFLGQKLSITSRKPQTTRHSLLGIKTKNNNQIIYIDTPGLHQRMHNAMNRYLNRAAINSIDGVDVIVWLVEALQWTDEDNYVLKALAKSSIPTILAVNKVDRVSDKNVLLPYLKKVTAKYNFIEVFPISALKEQNLEQLETKIVTLLPKGILLFPEEQITDRSEKFLCAEIVREKLVRRLGAELPYRLTVQIEHFKNYRNVNHISALIWVETEGQKGIIIGKKGQVLKSVGKEAREDMETWLDHKVYLQLWVKVKQGWCDSERALQQLGYSEY
ncbi:GTPase Era [Candidatus Halobeggiatoa sp. HSG11]|nr:GTPase Era [Candidatus Halobeggiatoa sp. HSG11]